MQISSRGIHFAPLGKGAQLSLCVFLKSQSSLLGFGKNQKKQGGIMAPMTETIEINTRKERTFLADRYEVERLSAKLQGDIITPWHPAYEQQRRVWNGMIDRHPALIVLCSSEADVVNTVDFVRTNDLRARIRGGKHNVSGKAVSDGGVVIDVSPMRGIRVDTSRMEVTVQSGATLGDMERTLQRSGVAVPTGLVSATGIAGLTLGGGYGWLTRRFGLTSDNLLSAEVVTYEGRLRRASKKENPDLFWALRGGGGQLGVVTSFTFRVHHLTSAWMAIPMYPIEQAGKVLRFLRDFMPQAPEELGVLATLWTSPDDPDLPPESRQVPVLMLFGCYTGPGEKGEEVVRPLREIDTPLVDMSGQMEWLQVQQLLDEDYPDLRRYYWKSLYLDELSEESIDIAIEQAARRPSSLSSLDIWMLGGAMHRSSPQSSSFANRNSNWMLGIEANWDDPHQDATNIDWTRTTFDRMLPHSSGGAYVNFGGSEQELNQMGSRFYGNNFPRLENIRKHYDPLGIFSG